MQIRVCYSELFSTGNFSNKKAEAEITLEVNNGKLQEAYDKAFKLVKHQVDIQLGKVAKTEINFDELPF